MLGHTFDGVGVFPSNRDAYHAVRAWARDRFSRTVLLVGPAGVGKSHLGHAAAAQLQSRGKLVRLASTDSFMGGYVTAARTNALAAYRREWNEGSDVLVVEHVDDLAGKDRTTDEVVELVLARYRRGSRSLLSATVTPTEKSMRRWLGRMAVRCGAHLVGIKTPRRGELADFASGLSAMLAEDLRW